MKRHRFILWVVIVVWGVSLAAVRQPAWALEVPALTGRVNDLAHLLQPTTVRHLETVLEELERSDSTQLAVVTIPSLEGDNLEAFSIRLAEAWQIGQKGRDNGAILLIVPKERKIRIEVGYGLEGRLTDLTAGRIIREVISPQFKLGHFDQGVSDGVAAMIQTVRGEFQAAPSSPASRSRNPGRSPSLLGVLALLFVISSLGRIKRGLGAVAGAILAPIAGLFYFQTGWASLLALIPIGLIGGLLLSLIGPALLFGHSVGRSRGRHWGGGGISGGFGGFSGGGGGGGFSGGGGGFGGGGSSGGW